MATDISELISSSKLQEGLYIVATPIGNLKDVSLRALEVLKNVDLVVCEDTRVTNKLLSHYGYKRRMISYNDHNAAKVRPRIIREINSGSSVALVSDAGTPLISDPGYKLVKEIQEQGIYITTIPGASSVLAALTIAGLPTDRFLFQGFLPTRKNLRTKIISESLGIDCTMVVLERGSRLLKTLEEMSEICGGREAAIVREITKAYEEVKKDKVNNLLAYYQKHGCPKGEIVIVLGPPDEKEVSDGDIEKRLKTLLKNMSLKQAAVEVSKDLGQPKKKIYSMALKIKDDKK